MNLLDRFKSTVLPVLNYKLSPERILIFGSYARGEQTEDSDIDVVVVASFFENMHFLDRMPYLLRLAPFHKHIDYICYTPDEFNDAMRNSSVIISASKEFIELN